MVPEEPMLALMGLPGVFWGDETFWRILDHTNTKKSGVCRSCLGVREI